MATGAVAASKEDENEVNGSAAEVDAAAICRNEQDKGKEAMGKCLRDIIPFVALTIANARGSWGVSMEKE
ncbi:uncharacterized protein MONOS_4877 [Monocercomonoides exilis]|uniref:uncharacterized protein n=1 Tax=Monocercomonoides exilis TaxID=2049356 RepID=UPI003559B3D0|nr:hypothetical protein MONOS_4883 [Monocercomonoides exilis]KAH7819685.1 hypothetical protein MONOS_4877 [Monocercomonoides exilis]|eukprot:MONOS_4877.1-p1 / transcript=MONOS_4877.1 / gene=MONOS_4877 / organism=Monocercomonoides_exilis_PA203 / gene_product=unspecified product / transcript_product=unspecified product / location=Mono_scaffold00136:46187-46396(-) / protein_length=70 / sequence_SO=supercontig / SO=protein_coding / is_pseudo=false